MITTFLTRELVDSVDLFYDLPKTEWAELYGDSGDVFHNPYGFDFPISVDGQIEFSYCSEIIEEQIAHLNDNDKDMYLTTWLYHILQHFILHDLYQGVELENAADEITLENLGSEYFHLTSLTQMEALM